MPRSESSLSDQQQAYCSLNKLWNLNFSPTAVSTPLPAAHTPKTSIERLESTSERTILYLAYGSNLSAETFKGNRGIKPLSAINVHVPSLSLTFDLAGIPYTEPCFANTRYRKTTLDQTPSTGYRKDRWKKGLIGVVYEVTPEDYRTIIATEGGGASYQDVVVDCYALSTGATTVHAIPDGPSFKAHTLLSPHGSEGGGRISRPDPSYAQASARYLKLITDGAEEHSLPEEYLAYLYSLRPYTITTYKQRIGSGIFLTIWLPIVMGLFGLSKTLADKDGKIPSWFAKIMGIIFQAVWLSYDRLFKNVFGDGERTIENEDEESWLGKRNGKTSTSWVEKRIRLEGS